MTSVRSIKGAKKLLRTPAKRRSAAPAVAPPEPQTLTLEAPHDGRSQNAVLAETAVVGLASNAITTVRLSPQTFGPLDLTACLNALPESAGRVNRGDLGSAEAMLSAQAVTLNAMFTALVDRALKADFVEAYERNIRYGLRAQAQCRATLETLAAIKNPPMVFARQANIANGPQQVNNTAQVPAGSRVRAISESCRPNSWRLMSNGWTPERRNRQAEAIRRWKPWESSTGPRSETGKRRSAMNRYRGGRRQIWRAFCRDVLGALAAHDRVMRALGR